MRTREITTMIRDAVAEEARDDRFSKYVNKVARQRGTKPTKVAVQGVVSFVREYVEHLPLFWSREPVPRSRWA
jgi:hypothetical protein